HLNLTDGSFFIRSTPGSGFSHIDAYAEALSAAAAGKEKYLEKFRDLVDQTGDGNLSFSYAGTPVVTLYGKNQVLETLKSIRDEKRINVTDDVLENIAKEVVERHSGQVGEEFDLGVMKHEVQHILIQQAKSREDVLRDIDSLDLEAVARWAITGEGDPSQMRMGAGRFEFSDFKDVDDAVAALKEFRAAIESGRVIEPHERKRMSDASILYHEYMATRSAGDIVEDSTPPSGFLGYMLRRRLARALEERVENLRTGLRMTQGDAEGGRRVMEIMYEAADKPADYAARPAEQGEASAPPPEPEREPVKEPGQAPPPEPGQEPLQDGVFSRKSVEESRRDRRYRGAVAIPQDTVTEVVRSTGREYELAQVDSGGGHAIVPRPLAHRWGMSRFGTTPDGATVMNFEAGTVDPDMASSYVGAMNFASKRASGALAEGVGGMSTADTLPRNLGAALD
ncbi:MAG: hypothetical protein N2Z74_09290, partial [Syntrophales bacterium]|nr:hypothetical protein [Syntrophales bacterium]